MIQDILKTLPQFLVPKHALTVLAGFAADIKTPAIKNYLISSFIEKYDVNMKEALEENPQNYSSFNDFFIRHLKPDSRPLANAKILSPVDGIISELGQIEQEKILQAKGRFYNVHEFLACEQEWYEPFINGSFATLYLAPKDYHRIHMPIAATLRRMIHVPGKLFSVQPTTTRVIRHLFARNERLVVFFDTAIGLMAMVLVGATIVGAIGTSWHGEIKRNQQTQRFDYPTTAEQCISLQQGEEMGYFKLGSTVVLMFNKKADIEWKKTLLPGSAIRYGQTLVP